MQGQERRNAENLSESVGISARALQHFLTEARWSDDTVIGRLQEYLAPRLGHAEAVWVFDGSDFPKQGRKSVGVARQYCGRLGKERRNAENLSESAVANCQAGMFLAYVSPLGRSLVDKGLYLPESWTSDRDRCAAAGVPEERRSYRSKTGLALELLERALALGHLNAGWVAGDDALGMSPSFREALAALGMRYVLDVPGSTTYWPLELAWTSPEYPGFGRPRKPRLRDGQRRTMEQGREELVEEACREVTVAQGSQGRGSTSSARNGCGPPGGINPARRSEPSGAGTWTAASPGTTCPTLPKTPPWRPWPAWAVPGGASRRSLRRRRATWGWTNTRPVAGPAGITTWPCACWAESSC